jgi:hypothetical protein
MNPKPIMEYSVIPKKARYSPMAIAAALCGIIGTPAMWLFIGLWSISVEGFKETRTASHTLRFIWNCFQGAAVLVPIALGCAAVYRIRRSAGQLRGTGLAVVGMAVPLAIVCLIVLSIFRRL